MEYPKINSIYKREGVESVDGKFRKGHNSNKLIEGDYSRLEYPCVRHWNVSEKVDGTNIRIYFQKMGDDVFCPPFIQGRTQAAQIPATLFAHLQTIATWECFGKAFPELMGEENFRVVLYGEGYGPKIQGCGSLYRNDPGFILFDVLVGSWWLKQEDMRDIAEKLGVPSAPFLGIMNDYQVVEYIKSKPLSKCSNVPQVMEGVVCRSEPLMLTRDQKPVMFKLKCKEFF